jgi:SAM-dependent methyltransferase
MSTQRYCRPVKIDNSLWDDRDRILRQRVLATAGLANKYLDSSSLVVDVGANDGTFRRFVNHGSWVTVDKYGDPDFTIDINHPSVELPFEDRSVDVVICTEVLEHLTLGSPLVAEISRVLKADGRAVISVPNIASIKNRVRLALGAMPLQAASGDCGAPLGGNGYLIDGHWVGGHVVDFNEDRLVRYLQRGNLEVTDFGYISLIFGQTLSRDGRGFLAPRWLPRRLLDYSLVAARPAGY